MTDIDQMDVATIEIGKVTKFPEKKGRNGHEAFETVHIRVFDIEGNELIDFTAFGKDIIVKEKKK